MINNIVSTIFMLLFKVLAFIGDLILLPITLLINNLFPDMSSYISSFETFCNTYVFKGAAFFREAFLNITHFPRSLLGLGVSFILAVWGFRLGTHIFKFVMNLWSFFRKGSTND